MVVRETGRVTSPYPTRSCPCGSASYDACCGRLHRGEEQAATAEELMRSRYSAYALGETRLRLAHLAPEDAPAAGHPGPQHPMDPARGARRDG